MLKENQHSSVQHCQQLPTSKAWGTKSLVQLTFMDPKTPSIYLRLLKFYQFFQTYFKDSWFLWNLWLPSTRYDPFFWTAIGVSLRLFAVLEYSLRAVKVIKHRGRSRAMVSYISGQNLNLEMPQGYKSKTLGVTNLERSTRLYATINNFLDFCAFST